MSEDYAIIITYSIQHDRNDCLGIMNCILAIARESTYHYVGVQGGGVGDLFNANTRQPHHSGIPSIHCLYTYMYIHDMVGTWLAPLPGTVPKLFNIARCKQTDIEPLQNTNQQQYPHYQHVCDSMILQFHDLSCTCKLNNYVHYSQLSWLVIS